jgi:hypothetical protein
MFGPSQSLNVITVAAMPCDEETEDIISLPSYQLHLLVVQVAVNSGSGE